MIYLQLKLTVLRLRESMEVHVKYSYRVWVLYLHISGGCTDKIIPQWLLWGFLFRSYVSLCKLTGNMDGSKCQMRIQSKERQQLQHEGAHVLRCAQIRYNVRCVCGANWWLSALLLSQTRTLWKLGAVKPIVPASVYHFCHSRSEEGQAVCSDALQHPRNTKNCQRGFFRNYRLKMEWHTELPQACTTGNIKTTHHHFIQLCRAPVQLFPLVALVLPTYIYLNTVLKYNSKVFFSFWSISIFCYFILPLLHIGGKYCTFHFTTLSDYFSYKLLYIILCIIILNELMWSSVIKKQNHWLW